MTRRRIPLLPLVILPLSAVLLQYHSVAFWSWAITGMPVVWGLPLLAAPWNGWGWSALFELVNLWAWSRRWHVLAGITTVLLVGGPLYQVSDPLVRRLAEVPVAAREETPRIQALRAEIAALEATLEAYRGDWRLRPRIPEAQAELRARNVDLAALLEAQAAGAHRASLDWRRWAVIAGQLLGILIAQSAAVLAIMALSGGRPRSGAPASNAVALDANGAGPSANGHEGAERPEKAAIRSFARHRGLTTQRAVAEAIGEPASTLSEFANGRPLPDETRRRIAAALRVG